jgi:hypothetical protein
LNEFDRERVGQLVHQHWCATQRTWGFHGPDEKCGLCNESYSCSRFNANLVPWPILPENQKEMKRQTFDVLLPYLEQKLVAARLEILVAIEQQLRPRLTRDGNQLAVRVSACLPLRVYVPVFVLATPAFYDQSLDAEEPCAAQPSVRMFEYVGFQFGNHYYGEIRTTVHSGMTPASHLSLSESRKNGQIPLPPSDNHGHEGG